VLKPNTLSELGSAIARVLASSQAEKAKPRAKQRTPNYASERVSDPGCGSDLSLSSLGLTSLVLSSRLGFFFEDVSAVQAFGELDFVVLRD